MSISELENLTHLSGFPKDWQVLPIESLCLKVTSGGTPSRKNPAFYKNGSILWIKTQELKDWYIEDSQEKITEEALKKSSAKLLPVNTVLMAMYGDGRTITSLGILRKEAATNQACCALVPNFDICEPLYLFYLLTFHRNHLIKLALGGAQRNLSGTIIRNFKVKVPPLPIQRKIAGILSAYDRLIENNTRRIEILEEIARSIFREWFVNFRFPCHEQVQMVDSELGPIPEGWKITSIGNHINTQKGYAFKSSWYQEEGIKIVKVSDFTDDSIDITKLVSISEEIAGQHKKHELEANDIIIQTVGSWASNPQSVVGKVIRVPKIAAQTLLNQNAVKVIPKESINQFFLFYCLKNERFKSYIIGCAQGAASQASITLDAIREFNILLPPSSLLDSLEDFVSPMWKLINNLDNKNLNLRFTRDYLLPSLISGEIDVENLDIKTEEVAA